MASSSYNPYVTVEVEEEYPYPSHVCAPNFVTLKLSDRDEYGMWRTQMLCLLESHGMYGFINGTLLRHQTGVSASDHHTHSHRLWRRSDALVKGWILGSLSKQTLIYVLDRITEKLHQQIDADFTAKDVWDELQTIYGPPVLPQLGAIYGIDVPSRDLDRQLEDKERATLNSILYDSTLSGDWDDIEDYLRTTEVIVIDRITNNGNTLLHLAVGTSMKHEFLQKMLEWTPENTRLLDVQNSNGSSLLHVAAIVGNTEAIDILLGRNRDFLFAKDNEGYTPLAIALSNMHRQTSHHLLQHINSDMEKDTLFSGTSGDELLDTVISSKDFGLANDLLRHYRTLHSDAVLMAIAQNFPVELNMVEESMAIGTDQMIPYRVRGLLEHSFDYMVDKCVPFCGSRVEKLFRLFSDGIYAIFMLFLAIFKMIVWPFVKKRVRISDDARNLLGKVCMLIRDSKDYSSHHHYYMNPILEAARQNSYTVVKDIVYYFPNAIWSANKDGHNIIQYAVINRSEKVYNILYQMSTHKNLYRTMKDSSGNNLLHLAASLAPTNKTNLISGAALQIQRELQWFKEVKGFVCPLNVMQKNSFGETPPMVFTREHKDMVIEGEKWMKATAESYTITAALITTIVFAAAITVPGGNNQDTGIPIFTKSIAFTIFAISDAISLFTSVTSLLMFLSILTARFAEQDFLFKLPTKLIIGLATLFISTTTMILAFGATLYLVFGQKNSKILLPIAVLTCLPIASFVTLQFPLVIELVSATYGRSIFGKKNNLEFY